MSELDRIGRIGRAYWNRIKDGFEGSPESEAERELREAMENPIPTTQGGAQSRQSAPEPQSDERDWARRKLGAEPNLSGEELKKRYQALDRKAKKLIKALEARMVEKPEEADLDRLTLNEAKKLRADLAKAYKVLSEGADGVTKRFHALELDGLEPAKPAKKSTAKTSAAPSGKSEPPRAKPNQAEQTRSNPNKSERKENGATKRFRSLEIE